MLESLKHKIERSEDMLKEYNHLIDADQADCSMYFPPDQGNAKQTEEDDDDYYDFMEEVGADAKPAYLQCWARKYGASLFSLAGIIGICSVIFYLAIGDVREWKRS